MKKPPQIVVVIMLSLGLLSACTTYQKVQTIKSKREQAQINQQAAAQVKEKEDALLVQIDQLFASSRYRDSLLLAKNAEFEVYFDERRGRKKLQTACPGYNSHTSERMHKVDIFVLGKWKDDLTSKPAQLQEVLQQAARNMLSKCKRIHDERYTRQTSPGRKAPNHYPQTSSQFYYDVDKLEARIRFRFRGLSGDLNNYRVLVAAGNAYQDTGKWQVVTTYLAYPDSALANCNNFSTNPSQLKFNKLQQMLGLVLRPVKFGRPYSNSSFPFVFENVMMVSAVCPSGLLAERDMRTGFIIDDLESLGFGVNGEPKTISMSFDRRELGFYDNGSTSRDIFAKMQNGSVEHRVNWLAVEEKAAAYLRQVEEQQITFTKERNTNIVFRKNALLDLSKIAIALFPFDENFASKKDQQYKDRLALVERVFNELNTHVPDINLKTLKRPQYVKPNVTDALYRKVSRLKPYGEIEISPEVYLFSHFVSDGISYSVDDIIVAYNNIKMKMTNALEGSEEFAPEKGMNYVMPFTDDNGRIYYAGIVHSRPTPYNRRQFTIREVTPEMVDALQKVAPRIDNAADTGSSFKRYSGVNFFLPKRQTFHKSKADYIRRLGPAFRMLYQFDLSNLYFKESENPISMTIGCALGLPLSSYTDRSSFDNKLDNCDHIRVSWIPLSDSPKLADWTRSYGSYEHYFNQLLMLQTKSEALLRFVLRYSVPLISIAKMPQEQSRHDFIASRHDLNLKALRQDFLSYHDNMMQQRAEQFGYIYKDVDYWDSLNLGEWDPPQGSGHIEDFKPYVFFDGRLRLSETQLAEMLFAYFFAKTHACPDTFNQVNGSITLGDIGPASIEARFYEQTVRLINDNLTGSAVSYNGEWTWIDRLDSRLSSKIAYLGNFINNNCSSDLVKQLEENLYRMSLDLPTIQQQGF